MLKSLKKIFTRNPILKKKEIIVDGKEITYFVNDRDKIDSKYFSLTPISIDIRNATVHSTKKNIWTYKEVKVYYRNTLIFTYLRKYPSYALTTFSPFFKDNTWYFLYSDNYTQIRCGKILPDLSVQIIAETYSDSFSFCPVEIYNFFYKNYTYSTIKGELEHFTLSNCGITEEKYEKEGFTQDAIIYPNFALISGCIWGDDSSWKLRILDLSEIERGKLTSPDIYYNKYSSLDFTYVQLANTIKDSVTDISILDNELLSCDYKTIERVKCTPLSKKEDIPTNVQYLLDI